MTNGTPEYNEDDFITHFYPKQHQGNKLGVSNDYRATGITVPAEHPDYQRQYWDLVRKPRLQAERDRAKGLLTVEESWDVVRYALSIIIDLEDALDAFGQLAWHGAFRTHNGIRWVFILWDSEEAGEWAALVNGQIHSDTDPFGDHL